MRRLQVFDDLRPEEELAEVWRSSSRYKTGPELAAAALTSMGLRTELIVPLAPSERPARPHLLRSAHGGGMAGFHQYGGAGGERLFFGSPRAEVAAALSRCSGRGESGGLRAFAYLLRPKGLVDDEQRLSRCD